MVPIQTEGHVTGEKLQNESFSFDTTAIGQPHWIKISYFPNWHVEGAKGPYLASPSFMMVIPTQSHVTLTYGRTGANTLGQVLEVIAWILLVALAVWRTISVAPPPPAGRGGVGRHPGARLHRPVSRLPGATRRHWHGPVKTGTATTSRTPGRRTELDPGPTAGRPASGRPAREGRPTNAAGDERPEDDG